MDACDLFEQNHGLKVKIICICYVPDSGICMYVIRPLFSDSMVFNAMAYRKKRVSITSDFGLEFL